MTPSTRPSVPHPSPGAMPPAEDGRPAGAYGLRVSGVGWAKGLLATVSERWPQVSIDQRSRIDHAKPQRLDRAHAVVDLGDFAGRRLVIDRDAATATFEGPALAPDALVHPYLGPVASIFARWQGREAFHAGGVVFDGGAWALVGDKEAGKSTLLTALASEGKPVISDDLAVVEGDRVLAGPRCIDLRSAPPPELAGRLGAVRARKRSRWRMHLSRIDAELPLRGWVFLDWGERLGLTPVPASETLSWLTRWRAWNQLEGDRSQLLALAALPALRLARPRRMDAIHDTISRLEQRCSAAAR
jgi:hypothetical protein